MVKLGFNKLNRAYLVGRKFLNDTKRTQLISSCSNY